MVHQGQGVERTHWAKRAQIIMACLAGFWMFAGIFSCYYVPYLPWADLHKPMVVAGTGFWGLLFFLLVSLKVDGETGWSRMLRYQDDGQGRVVPVVKATVSLVVVCAALGWLTPSVLGMSAYVHAGSSESVEVSHPTIERPRRTSDTYRIGVSGKFQGEFDWNRHSNGFPSLYLPYLEHRTIACLHLDYRPGLFGVIVESVRDCVSPAGAQEGTESAEAQRSRLENFWEIVLVVNLVVVLTYKIVTGLRTGRLDMFTHGLTEGHVYERKAERWGFYRGILILALALLVTLSMVLVVHLHRAA